MADERRSGAHRRHPLVPESKFDVDRAKAAVAAGYPAVASVLDRLFEWIQDCNWPVAGIISPFLGSLGATVVPHVQRVLATDDDIWKYWVLNRVVAPQPDVIAAIHADLERIARNPSPGEREQGVLEVVEVLLRPRSASVDEPPTDPHSEAEAWLRSRMARSGATWCAHAEWGGREDIEFEVADAGTGPSNPHLAHAAVCLAAMPSLIADSARALDAVQDPNPLFPPRDQRRWCFLGFSFRDADPNVGEALFTQDEDGGAQQYLYVLYLVRIVGGHAGEASARNW